MQTPFLDAANAAGSHKVAANRGKPETRDDEPSFSDQLAIAPERDNKETQARQTNPNAEAGTDMAPTSSSGTVPLSDAATLDPEATAELINAAETIATTNAAAPEDGATLAATAEGETLKTTAATAAATLDTAQSVDPKIAGMREAQAPPKADTPRAPQDSRVAPAQTGIVLDAKAAAQHTEGAAPAEAAALETKPVALGQAIDGEAASEAAPTKVDADHPPLTDTVDELKPHAEGANASTAQGASDAKLSADRTTATPAAPFAAAPSLQTAPSMQTVAVQAAAQTSPPTIVASPADIPDIVSRTLQSQEAGERIVVQLDPPELGRVTIDFKLDPDGVQAVTVTAETPEAIKRLRLMNFELLQALEQNGLNGRSFSLEYQQSDQGETGQSFEASRETSFESEQLDILASQPRPAYMPPGSSLNLRL